MRHHERDFDRDHRNRSQRHSDRNNSERYSDSGNYYGRHDMGNESREQRNRDYSRDRQEQGRMHQSDWGGSDYGSRRDRSQGDHYHYGDPNPYMHNQRNRSYDNSDNWRSEDVDHANRRYDRQENSYRQTGFGRRFDEYGRDEKRNFSHDQTSGRRSIEHSENLDDRYYDRGEHSRSSSDNDYGRNYGSQYDHRNRNRQGRDDDYESRRYQDRDRDQSPSRSPRGYGLPSGPDYSANSPISNYGPSVRGHQK